MRKVTLISSFFLVSATAVAQQYQVFDLGMLGGQFAVGFDLNDSGVAVGYIANVGPIDEAFTYANGVSTVHTELGNAHFHGINSGGTMVGFSRLLGGAITYENGVATVIVPGSIANAYSINDAGVVVGNFGGSVNHAYRYDHGTTTDLGVLNGDVTSVARGINESGVIVGQSSLGNGVPHAFVYDGNGMQNLGTLGGNQASAMDINNAGVIVGTAAIANGNQLHAFVYTGGVMSDLGTLGGNFSQASGINESGTIVGEFNTVNHRQHGFIYRDGQMIDLNDITVGSTMEIEDAQHINESGQIVGYGIVGNEMHAYFATPVPEPTTILGVLIPIGLLLRKRPRA